MFWRIIIGALVGYFVVCFAYNYFKDNPNEDLTGLCNDINWILHIVKEFKNNSYWQRESGPIYIVPAHERNSNEHRYYDRVVIKILLYDKDEGIIKSCSEGLEITDWFELVREDNMFVYKTRAIGSYKGSYQKVFSQIYKSIVSEFPNIEIEKTNRGYLIIEKM